MVTDKYSIRKLNEATIIEQIIYGGTISRASLAQKTLLNKATVSEITKKLIDEHLVEEIGEGESTTSGGRKPIMLRFNKNAGTTISIDLGNDYIASCLTLLNGDIIFSEKIKHIHVDRFNVLELLTSTIENYEQQPVLTNYGIIGITIAIHGIVQNNQIVFTPYYDLDKMNLHEDLQKIVDYPVFLENEANLTAVAEGTFSTEYDQLISLSIHSGIGAGIILNRSLYTGKDGKAGEIGHNILIPDGKYCPCGNSGCLEQYCSEKVILADYAKKINKIRVTPDDLKNAYFSNEPLALEAIQKMSASIAIGINNLTTSFAPDIIFLNSPIIRRIPDAITIIKNNLMSSFSQDIEIRNSALGSKSSLLGATSVSIKNFLNVKQLRFIDSKNNDY